MISGDFMAAHSAKCARFSASVRLPLPTSSMSGSLWPQKSTELRRKLFSLAMVAMRGQFAGRHISSVSCIHMCVSKKEYGYWAVYSRK